MRAVSCPALRAATAALALVPLAGCGGAGLEHREIAPVDGPVATLASVPGSTRLAVVSRSGRVHVVNAASGAVERELGPVPGAAQAVGTAAGQVWVRGHDGGSVAIVRFDAGDGRELGRIETGAPHVNWMSATPGGRFVHADFNRATVVWDGATGERVGRVPSDLPARSRLSADGATAAIKSGDLSRSLRVAMTAQGATLHAWPESTSDFFTDFGLTPSGDHVLAVHSTRQWTTYDTTAGETLKTSRQDELPQSLHVAADGTFVAAGGDGRVRVVDPRTHAVLFEKQPQGGGIGHHQLAFLEGGAWAATADLDGTVRVFRLGP